MKKIIMVFACGLMLAACVKGGGEKTDNTQVNKPEDKNIFSTIKEAVQKQIMLKCEYTDEDGQMTTTYIKGQMVRMVGTGKEADVEGLMRDNKFYLWSKNDKKGMVLEMTSMQGSTMGKTPIKSVDDVIGVLEAEKDKCSVSTESGAMFEVPTDVKFEGLQGLFDKGVGKSN